MYFYLPHMTFSVHIRFSILYWYRTMNAPDGASCHLFFISHFCCYVLFAEVIRRHTHKLRTGSKPEGKVHNRRMKTFTVRILSYKQPKKKIIMHQNTFLHILYSVMPSDSAKKRRSASKNKYNLSTLATALSHITSINIAFYNVFHVETSGISDSNLRLL